MNQEIRIGVAGVGHMGKYHINVLSQIKNINFTGVYDTNQEIAKTVSSEFNVVNYPSFKELYQHADAIILATPTSTHYELGKEILLAGKHLLIEKPITDDLAKAQELVDLAQTKKQKLLIGHVERYNAAVQELENLIKEPYFWESRRVSPNTSNRIFDVGVVLDLLIHDIDILLRVMKKKVVSISASGNKIFNDNEDVVQSVIKFENGTVAGLMASRVHHLKERQLWITQKDESILLDFTTQDISIYRNAQSQVTTSKGSIRYQQHSNMERMFIHKENPLKLELEYFIKLINEDLSNNNELDLETLKISLEIIRQI